MKISKDCCTEDHIKLAAKKLFFYEGKFGATTQEIADAAGVNRTLLNYYFRSRDELFKQVYIEARQEIEHRLDEAFSIDLPFREKIEQIIDVFGNYITTVPFIEIFLISEINNYSDPLAFQTKRDKTILNQFLAEVALEVEKGTIRPIEPLNFIINLFSLISHPVLLKPLYFQLYDLNLESFDVLFRERKQMIIRLLFNK